MLEMRVNSSNPQPITWNYEELKKELVNILKQYENRVYTEEDIPAAKSERATLNNLKKALNDERIRREKEYMIPFSTFKEQVKELCDLIDSTSKSIGTQLDAFEQNRINEKRLSIELEYKSCVLVILGYADIPDWLSLDHIFDEKWLNKSVTIEKVSTAIKDRLTQIHNDINTLEEMKDFTAVECYKKCLNINQAIKDSRDIRDIEAKAQEEQKQVTIEEINPEPKPEAKSEAKASEQKWVNFRAFVTLEQAKQLKVFCDEHGIMIAPIKEV